MKINFIYFFGNKLEFLIVNTLNAFQLDSLESSHPINVEVNDPAEINFIFDDISYGKVNFQYFKIRFFYTRKNSFLSKGSNLIRMMNAFLTEKTFRKAISV